MKLKKILLEMFQKSKIGYNKKEDKFIGIVELPDEVLNQAILQINQYILKQINKIQKPHEKCVEKSKKHCWCIVDFINEITTKFKEK